MQAHGLVALRSRREEEDAYTREEEDAYTREEEDAYTQGWLCYAADGRRRTLTHVRRRMLTHKAGCVTQQMGRAGGRRADGLLRIVDAYV